jgi:hypothetical protein
VSSQLQQVLGKRTVALNEVRRLTPSKLLKAEDESEPTLALKDAERGFYQAWRQRDFTPGGNMLESSRERLIESICGHPGMEDHHNASAMVGDWVAAISRLTVAQNELARTPMGARARTSSIYSGR